MLKTDEGRAPFNGSIWNEFNEHQSIKSNINARLSLFNANKVQN